MIPLLNVSFGIYAFLPGGWLFMIVIIAIECVGLSWFLKNSRIDSKIYWTVISSNLVSGALGIIGSLLANGGWWLVVWFPWVSANEVGSMDEFIPYYVLAFVLSVLMEGLINYLALRQNFKGNMIFMKTIQVNTISYLFGTLVMYAYSF